MNVESATGEPGTTWSQLGRVCQCFSMPGCVHAHADLVL